MRFYKTLIILLLGLVLAGCQTDFIGYPKPFLTITPTPEQVQYCRSVIYLNPEIEIQPVGLYLQKGMDELMRFKFIAKVENPAELFEQSKVDAAKMESNINVKILQPEAKESWWDVSGQRLAGGSFIIPARETKGECGLNLGYKRNLDKTLTVYVLWQET